MEIWLIRKRRNGSVSWLKSNKGKRTDLPENAFEPGQTGLITKISEEIRRGGPLPRVIVFSQKERGAVLARAQELYSDCRDKNHLCTYYLDRLLSDVRAQMQYTHPFTTTWVREDKPAPAIEKDKLAFLRLAIQIGDIPIIFS